MAVRACSLIGMALIIVGLYSFLWGKHKDMKAARPLPVIKESGDGRSSGGDGQAAAALPESAKRSKSTFPVIIPAASVNRTTLE